MVGQASSRPPLTGEEQVTIRDSCFGLHHGKTTGHGQHGGNGCPHSGRIWWICASGRWVGNCSARAALRSEGAVMIPSHESCCRVVCAGIELFCLLIKFKSEQLIYNNKACRGDVKRTGCLLVHQQLCRAQGGRRQIQPR
ncbi:unnamed protein product [Protopolystoma xenopodis]|uniref:Uncharacterized protein n=1 Tax=Protopolystoma xenopodis TaxID=117903 RepID=A0A3S5B5S3_9PLAT|nr:unnamed protein product [Protopolystoma xenopodis]